MSDQELTQEQSEKVESEQIDEYEAVEVTTEQFIEEKKQHLIEKIDKLCREYGWVRNDKPSGISLANMLSSTSCERRAKYALVHQSKDSEQEKKFDPIFREKSDYACNLIISHLKTRLLREGFKVDIRTEERDLFGIYDVVIYNTSPIRVVKNGQEKVRIELKASAGLPLPQIGRYLYDSSPLILVRVIIAIFISREVVEDQYK